MNEEIENLEMWLDKNLTNSFRPHIDEIPNSQSKGIYFWFMKPEGYEQLSNYEKIKPVEYRYTTDIDGECYDLVYLGTTGTGKKGKSTLKLRLDWHINQKHLESTINQKNSALSTLRTAIGALIAEDLIEPYTEMLVNEFMNTYFKIYYLEYPNNKALIDNHEKILIKRLKPLFNITFNSNSYKNSPNNSTKFYRKRRNEVENNTKKRLKGLSKNVKAISQVTRCVEFKVKRNQNISEIARNVNDLPNGPCFIKIFSNNTDDIRNYINGQIRNIRAEERRVDEYFDANDTQNGNISRSTIIKAEMNQEGSLIEEITVRVCPKKKKIMARNKEHKFKLNNEEYHLTWIDKPRITKNGIEQKVLPILREYIITENLAIQLVNNNGKDEVPYTLARKVLGYFSSEKKSIDKKKVVLNSHKKPSNSSVLIDKNLIIDLNVNLDKKIENLVKKLDLKKTEIRNKKKLLIIGCSHSKNSGGNVNLDRNYFIDQTELIDNRYIRFNQYSELLLNNQNYFQENRDYYLNLFNNQLYLPAIDRYKGRFYKEALKQLYLEKNENANLHILIVSGLYGVIEFKDSIIDYHLEISRKPFWTSHNNNTINEAITNYIQKNQIDNKMVFYSLSQRYTAALKPLKDWNNIWIIHDQGDASVRFLKDHFLPSI